LLTFNGSPLDLLLHVLFLLGLQGQLDEDLLQLLVHVVDAKLFDEHLSAGAAE
jgi:hypothetical protein